ncbi:TniB family NTP-binding protein [Paraburkholderia sp. BL10I2N1]|uniref:TniB family NTP-binding protein n=1 Tax=Paraburkholderia sp. BL10I2N1 TaxID=1938796 RepID=UPI00105F49B8|nr:TniB family NTP-binding protein [Paraburkholderia sp. BL10I2N1]TDN62438.1 TniB protein [Paraburkholderia sp. BL10I2N1]
MISKEQAIAGSRGDKNDYVRNLLIPHSTLNTILEEVEVLMEQFGGLSIILIVGPTGWGKSAFGRKLLRDLIQIYAYQIQEDPSIIPAVMVDVDSADRRYGIDFGFLYARICMALLAPSVLDGFGMPQNLGRPLDPTENSRMTLENAIVGRKLQHLILDEVIHFLNSATPPVHYGNLLKSLSNRSNFHLVLIGAYGSEALIHATAQLARRITVIHCPRYKQCKEDFEEYATFIKSVAAHMPYHFEIDLQHDVEYMFEGTFGLPGASVQVILEAAARCSKEKRPRWSKTNLVKSMPSLEEHRQIAMETLRGEERIQSYLQGELVKTYPTEAELRRELDQERHEDSQLNRRRGQ